MTSPVTTGVGLVLAAMFVAGECRAATDSILWLDTATRDVGRSLLNRATDFPEFRYMSFEVPVPVVEAYLRWLRLTSAHRWRTILRLSPTLRFPPSSVNGMRI